MLRARNTFRVFVLPPPLPLFRRRTDSIKSVEGRGGRTEGCSLRNHETREKSRDIKEEEKFPETERRIRIEVWLIYALGYCLGAKIIKARYRWQINGLPSRENVRKSSKSCFANPAKGVSRIWFPYVSGFYSSFSFSVFFFFKESPEFMKFLRCSRARGAEPRAKGVHEI